MAYLWEQPLQLRPRRTYAARPLYTRLAPGSPGAFRSQAAAVWPPAGAAGAHSGSTARRRGPG